MPNLTQKWKKQERISQLQVAYSILQNATKLAVAEHGDMSSWESENAKVYIEKYFIPYVKTKDQVKSLQDFTASNDYHIFNFLAPTSDLSSIRRYAGAYGVTLDNGMIVHLLRHQMLFMIDVNGVNGPNMLGNDIFEFMRDANTNKLNPNYESDDNDCIQNYSGSAAYAGLQCAYNIITNGWKIPDDYPIKKF